ncbi:MAG: diaminopimelate decarboxylase [Anaeroplasmataceae bacterium]
MMELKIGNITCKELAEKYQTPLYVYDEANMVKLMGEYVSNFKSNEFKTKVLFASKAFACMEMYKLVEKNGLGSDVVSGGELYAALKSGVTKENIYFHGNNKQASEVEFALNNDVLNMVVDSYDELTLLDEIAGRLNKKANVLFRLNSGVDAHTHKFIVTSHIDSKFGMLLDSDDINKCISLVRESKNLVFKGFHSHIGSQIFEINAFYAAIDKLVKYLTKFPETLTLNLGGGFGVKYTDEDHPIAVPTVAQLVIKRVEEQLHANNVKIEELIIEPGRSIVAESGYTLYTVGNTKVTPNKKYYFIDGGMADNIRPALYQAKYAADIATNMDAQKTEKVCVAGKCCESGDIIIEEINLQPAKRGDIMCVYTTGAYGYSMSSHYNKAQTPAVVFVNGNKARVVIKRETYEDLYRNDCSMPYDEF